jgi:hypothetical protein
MESLRQIDLAAKFIREEHPNRWAEFLAEQGEAV